MRTQLFVVKKEDDIFYLAVTFTFPIKIIFFFRLSCPSILLFLSKFKIPKPTGGSQQAGLRCYYLTMAASVMWKHAGSLVDRTIM